MPAKSGSEVGQCEMCNNGAPRHDAIVDGDELSLCSSCYELLEQSGRVGIPA